MITLIRWILLKQKEIKWKLAFWQYADKQLTGIIKNPEATEEKIMHYLINFADQINQTNEMKE